VHVQVTGTGGGSWDWTGVSTQAGFVTFLTNDQAFGPLAAGTHTIKLWLDYDDAVNESDESNNYYERTITVTGSGGGPWTALANPLPAGTFLDTCLLLTDGTVMCHEYETNRWHRR